MDSLIRVILICLIALPVHATSCSEKSIAILFEDAEYIFLGKVSEIKIDTVEFKVERFWKAALDTNQIELHLHQNSRDVLFQKGQEYIVYVRNGEYGNKTSYCDGTKLKSDALLDIKYLNKHH